MIEVEDVVAILRGIGPALLTGSNLSVLTAVLATGLAAGDTRPEPVDNTLLDLESLGDLPKGDHVGLGGAGFLEADVTVETLGFTIGEGVL